VGIRGHDIAFGIVEGKVSFVLLRGLIPKTVAEVEAFLVEQYPVPPRNGTKQRRKSRKPSPWLPDTHFDAVFPPLGRIDRRTKGGDWTFGNTRTYRFPDKTVRVTDVFIPANARHYTAAVGSTRHVLRHEDGRGVVLYDWKFDSEHAPQGAVHEVLLTDIVTMWGWILDSLIAEHAVLKVPLKEVECLHWHYDELCDDYKSSAPPNALRLHNAVILATVDEYLPIDLLREKVARIDDELVLTELEKSLARMKRLSGDPALRRDVILKAIKTKPSR
jgi:hypothetical protein